MQLLPPHYPSPVAPHFSHSPAAPADALPIFSSAKEKQFFNVPKRVARGLAHYAASFPPCDPARPTADLSTSYLQSPGALDAVIELYGTERIARSTFAVLLCDPVQRQQSSFYHFSAPHLDFGFGDLVHAAAAGNFARPCDEESCVAAAAGRDGHWAEFAWARKWWEQSSYANALERCTKRRRIRPTAARPPARPPPFPPPSPVLHCTAAGGRASSATCTCCRRPPS